MATLLCPEGAFDGTIAHGTQQFHPYRLNHLNNEGRDFGGPWAVDVPDELVQFFLGRGGFVIMSDQAKDRGDLPVGMARLRKIDGGDASCGYMGLSYPAEDDGTVLVPATAIAELVESHGYEIVEVPQPDDEGDEGDDRRVPRRPRGRPRKDAEEE
jgi:hypothetical protein